MAAILDVWICKPGDASQSDDGEWLVTIWDSSGNQYKRQGVTYADMPAPRAHWSAAMAPGCYVVWARQPNNVKKPLVTDHAVVCLGCDTLACARLYVAGEKPDGKCKITITGVVGLGEPSPESIQVTGTAAKCSKIKVSLSCAGSQTATTTIAVSPTGDWTATLNTKGLSCRCGGPVIVVATCTEDPKCEDKFKAARLNCHGDKAKSKKSAPEKKRR